VALKLLKVFHRLGASKLTVMGGEPSLYGRDSRCAHGALTDVIIGARDLGYEYIRIDTNGIFPSHFLEISALEELDEITFSLDGPTPEVNDPLRGTGTYEMCVARIREAIARGLQVDITSCVHRGFLSDGHAGQASVREVIRLAESLGARRINFHPVFKMGVPRDTWSGETDIRPQQWLAIRHGVERDVAEGKYGISVRVPARFVSREVYLRDKAYYGYCSARLGERVLIHPNGILRVCALLIGTPYGIGRFTDDRIEWNEGHTNELGYGHRTSCEGCCNQLVGHSDLVPLCISFKPRQDEYVWNQKLQWEDRRTDEAICDERQ
jgi:MoaA/NifB/PqqE/SkfB family radical SAM enzyme